MTATVTTATFAETLTSEATVTDTVTQTITDVSTATATPTCGVNLVQNGDFPAPQWSLWSFSYFGGASPQFNAQCGIDPYCPLVYITTSGRETWSQTIFTYPGQTYTLSYYANFGCTGNSGAECYTDASVSSPVKANVDAYTGATFVKVSGSFTATGLTTVLTCTAHTTAFHRD